MITLVLSLIAATAAHAGPSHQHSKAHEEKDPAFEVSVNPGVYSPDAFREKGFSTQELGPEPVNSFAPPAGETRDEIFAKVTGLEAEIAEMDALDRDLLFIRAKNYAPEKLRGIYPKISAEKLTALQLELRR
jgi:hypothetical protein